MGDIKVFKLNEYECYATPWNEEETVEWYKKEFKEEVEKKTLYYVI